MARNNHDGPGRSDEPQLVKRPRSPRNIAPERSENCATALMASRVFDTAAKLRGMSDTDLEVPMHSSRQTMAKKRSGVTALNLFDIESLSYILNIPAYLFLRPVSELLTYLASEASSTEENGARDQGIRPSTCNYLSAGHVPENVIDLRDQASELVS